MKRLFALVLAATLCCSHHSSRLSGTESAQEEASKAPLPALRADTAAKAQKAGTMPASCSPGTSPNVLPAATINTSSKRHHGRNDREIDFELFAGRTVTPQNKVRLSGKVDKDFMESPKVDVKVLEIL